MYLTAINGQRVGVEVEVFLGILEMDLWLFFGINFNQMITRFMGTVL